MRGSSLNHLASVHNHQAAVQDRLASLCIRLAMNMAHHQNKSLSVQHLEIHIYNCRYKFLHPQQGFQKLYNCHNGLNSMLQWPVKDTHVF